MGALHVLLKMRLPPKGLLALRARVALASLVLRHHMILERSFDLEPFRAVLALKPPLLIVHESNVRVEIRALGEFLFTVRTRVLLSLVHSALVHRQRRFGRESFRTNFTPHGFMINRFVHRCHVQLELVGVLLHFATLFAFDDFLRRFLVDRTNMRIPIGTLGEGFVAV